MDSIAGKKPSAKLRQSSKQLRLKQLQLLPLKLKQKLLQQPGKKPKRMLGRLMVLASQKKK